jgi:hypothetical protein
MATRGVLYVVYGSAIEKLVKRSIASLAEFHPELSVHVARLPGIQSHLCKSRMFDMSPFDETLFLDADTIVMGNLDFGFIQAKRFGLACCISSCPWARRYVGVTGDLVEYNSGVLFFTRSMKPLFTKWAALSNSVASSIRGAKERPHDQASFAQAVSDCQINPFVLPLNWNYRPKRQLSFFGPIKIWHDRADVPQALKVCCKDQSLLQGGIRYSGTAWRSLTSPPIESPPVRQPVFPLRSQGR